MKFFVKLLLVLALILAAFFIYVSTKPSAFDVHQTKLIKADVNTIFNTVNNYKTWENWTPWMKQDTTLIVTLNKKNVGVGAGYSWKSDKDAGGKMETVSLVKNKSIDQKMYFFNSGSSDVYWKFNEVKDGTEVTWGIKGDLGLIQKAAFTVVGGAKLLFMQTIVEGLNNLDDYVLKQPKKLKSDLYSIKKNGVVEYGGNYYVGLKTTTTIEELSATLDKILPDVLIYCMQNEIKKTGSLFNLYDKYDDKNNIVEVSSCVPVSDIVKVSDKYYCKKLERTTYYKTTLTGSYAHSDEAWLKAFEFIKNDGFEVIESKSPFEVYVKGHTHSKNPENWVTEIYIPIKNK